MEILREVYQKFKLENIKFSKISNVLKKLTCNDTNPLYKRFYLDKFSFNIQYVKWAEETIKIVM